MSTERANHISQLNPDYPTEKSDIGGDAEHIRMIKSVLKNDFPNFDVPMVLTNSQIEALPSQSALLNARKNALNPNKEAVIRNSDRITSQVLALTWLDLGREKDLPHGEVYALFYDDGGANVLSPEWVKCDGTNGTEDLTSKGIELVNGSSSAVTPISYYTGLYVVKYVGEN